MTTNTQTKKKDVIVIKKYANRRLYNTDTSCYVTLDDLCTMVKSGSDFVVYDAKTNEDLTRQVLTQIIFEQESKGYNLLPASFLKSIISFYDNKMSDFVPPYLETMMESFMHNQEKMKEYASRSLGGFSSPFSQFEEMGRQNVEFFKKAFSMFTPFDAFGEHARGAAKKPGNK
jgi:polyhydroxyalkanoate synthesis repressor PhaR